MQRFKTRALGLALLLAMPLGQGAQAGPSYSCDGRLTETEAAICDSAILSALDRDMAALYYESEAVQPVTARAQYWQQQLAWQRWRNSCGGDEACLESRYQDRIGNFEDALGRIEICALSDAPLRRFRNGLPEIVYPDGTIEIYSIEGFREMTIFPDGSVHPGPQFQTVVTDAFPVLPSGYAGWGERLEADLRLVLEGLLTPEEYASYDALISGRDYSRRILDHIAIIRHFSRELF